MKPSKVWPGLSLLMLLSLLTSGGMAGGGVLYPAKDVAKASPHILYSNQTGIGFEVTVPAYEVAVSDGTQHLVVTGFTESTSAGKPVLPYQSYLIGVPAEAEITLSSRSGQVESLGEGHRLALAPFPAPAQESLQPGGWRAPSEHESLSEDSLYPSSPVRLAEEGWLRDWRFIRVEVYPFQYNPAHGTLVWHKQLRIDVTFSGGKTPLQSPQNDALDALLKDKLLNYPEARAWRSFPPANRERAHTITGLSYKVVIDQDGLYRLSYADLQAAGMAVDSVDPRTFHLANQGRTVAIAVVGEADGSFDPQDYVLFYGQKFTGDWMAQQYADENHRWITLTQQLTDGTYIPWRAGFNAIMVEKYTDDNVYWLTEGGEAGPRMTTVDGAPSGSAPVPAYYPSTARAEQQNRWWTTHFQTEETWYWERALSFPRTYEITLSALATEALSATVRVEFGATVSNDYDAPDHHTRFTLNSMGETLDDAYWEGKSRYRFETSIDQANLNEGVNTLTFDALTDVKASRDFYFDWFEIDYYRQFRAENDQLAFLGESNGVWEYQVGGFNVSSVEILNVTDPLNPVRILNPHISGSGTYTASFETTHSDGAQFFAGAAAGQSPVSLSRYEPPDLLAATNQADYLMIAPHDFITVTQQLADYRISQGTTTRVVDLADVYNLFTDGITHPIAIKNFLAYTFANWQSPLPQYVLLVGDGHWNPRRYNVGWFSDDPIYMLPNLGWSDPWQGEVDTTNLLAAIVGDDLMPDLAIGRMLVNSVDELQVSVDKVIAYESQAYAGWQQRLLFVADNTDTAGNFELSSNTLIEDFTPSAFDPGRIYLGDFQESGTCGTPIPAGPQCPAVNHAITESLNITGALITTFNGHGSVLRWTHEQILLNASTYSDLPSLTNGDQLPVILSMTCLDGYWIGPSLDGTRALGPSIIEALTRAEAKGAIAAFTPSGLGISTGHDQISQGFFAAVFQDGIWTLGPATLAAKLNLYNTGGNYDLINTFTIFGDPALRLHSPFELDLTPDAEAKQGSLGQTVTYDLQVTNTGAVTDTYAILVTGNIWTTTIPLTMGPLAAGESAVFQVSVHIPESLPPGLSDTAYIELISQGDLIKTRQAVLTTTIVEPGSTPTATRTPTSPPSSTPTSTPPPGDPDAYIYLPLVVR